MKIKTALLAAFILLLIFLVRSPSLADVSALDPDMAVPVPIDAKTGFAFNSENYLSDREYSDPTISVTITTDRYLETDMWIARVSIAHPSQLRSAYAGRYGSQQTGAAASIAKRMNAVVAINGANYSFENHGVALLQGHLYRNRPNGQEDLLIIDDKGDFHIAFQATKDDFNAIYDSMGGSWEEGGAIVNVISFGPALIFDGEYAHETYYRYNTGGHVPAQRMVIAQTGPLSYLLVTCEGPESKNSTGLTLQEMADFVITLDCRIAYNLDGGSSSTLVFQDKKINSLDTRKVRPVADIIYFSSAIDEGR